MQEIKIPPQDKASEMSFLGCCFIDKTVIKRTRLVKEDFYNLDNQEIFSAMLVLKNTNQNIDIITVSSQLKNAKSKVQQSYLVELTATIAVVGNWENYEKIIIEKSRRRKLIELTNQFTAFLYEESRPLNTTLNAFKGDITRFSSLQAYLVERNPDLADSWYDNYGKGEVNLLKSGMGDLDHYFGGYQPSDLGIIIASTNVGKTTMLINMAINMALEGKRVLFFSLEMSSRQMNNRIVSIIGGHSAFEIKQELADKDTLYDTIIKYRDLPLTLVSKGSITSQDVISEALNQKLQDGVDVVFVDYLQRLTDRDGENETLRLTNIARRLKGFALDNNIPVITPAQVDKASHKNKKKEVEDVAGAKAIADEADVAFYMYEETVGESITEEEKQLYIKVAKSRDSEKGKSFMVIFDKRTLKMSIYDSSIERVTADEAFGI